VQISYHALAHNNPTVAEFHARKAVEFLPDNGQAHLNLGLALSMAGRIDQAIAAFERAVQLMPDDPQARKCLDDARRTARQPAIPTSSD
jgi:Flp pilus assembly protein TadD